MIIWLFGKSGAGKTTQAYMLKDVIDNSIVLDGDEMRRTISRDLGFSLEDRRRHLYRMAHIAMALDKIGCNVICAFITPTEEIRDMVHSIVPKAYFIWLHTEKNVYKNSPFETPKRFDIKCDTDNESILTTTRRILKEVGT